jgi:hypothetical protein
MHRKVAENLSFQKSCTYKSGVRKSAEIDEPTTSPNIRFSKLLSEHTTNNRTENHVLANTALLYIQIWYKFTSGVKRIQDPSQINQRNMTKTRIRNKIGMKSRKEKKTKQKKTIK